MPPAGFGVLKPGHCTHLESAESVFAWQPRRGGILAARFAGFEATLVDVEVLKPPCAAGGAGNFVVAICANL